MPAVEPLSRSRRLVILVTAFLGWMFAGATMSLLPLVADSATKEFLGDAASKTLIGSWFVKYIVAFLLGAACGGAVLGWLGDRWGRAKAMGISILWYAGWTGLSYFCTRAEQLLVLRFVACMGIGGMWPNGVALVSEAWGNVSRPMLAGLIGAAANVGILLFGLVAEAVGVTDSHWKWVFLAGSTPVLLGVLVLVACPESPRWRHHQRDDVPRGCVSIRDVFVSPLLQRTVVGILLGAVPLLGAWGASKWIMMWTGAVGKSISDPSMKPLTPVYWGLGATMGSLCGGWIANRCGRKLSYFGTSIASTLVAGYVFRYVEPANHWHFFAPIFLLGLIPTIYFGWLPLFLPELFPTGVRATGAGVAFNFGRIISAGVILSTTGLVAAYDGNFARIGATTSLIYLVGAMVIWAAPNTSGEMEDAIIP